MALALPKFRSFYLRLLVLVLGLIGATLAATYLLVSRANERNARDQIERELDRGVRLYELAVRNRTALLTTSVSAMSEDPMIMHAALGGPADPALIRPLLQRYAERFGAPMIGVAFLNAAGREVEVNNDGSMDDENRGLYRYLRRLIETDPAHLGTSFAYIKHRLHVLTIVPLYAPFPKMAGFFSLAFPIDQAFADELMAASRLSVTFVSTEDLHRLRVLATTLSGSEAQGVLAAVAANMKAPARIRTLVLAGQTHIALFRNQDLLGDNPVVLVLQRPLAAELAAARELENYLVLISLGALAFATGAAFWIARDLSGPVQTLAAHTRRVTAGDYTQRLDLHRADELGQLADSFNTMTAGLADRDRVRDLLGKVVSPEIAAQLLRSDVMLGGEEREVTILFSDIRNFTTLSERLAPAAVLALLNRYLDHMSRIVEQHGGVIDKYIGDAIMALFGAPVADPDAPGRALAAARAMSAALDELNRELVAEGQPALEIGIGVNTARVVAGNMGSKTRLNYTVIGDGVNVASRLQSLTKEPAYATRIIVSEATVLAARQPPPVRALGEVTVKGKTSTVKIFALA